MKDLRCRYCQQVFQSSAYHPQQTVCNQPACQHQRQRDYHRQKIASDPIYRQVCLETTEIYTRADPSVKLEALESVMPPKLRSGRFKATDKLIASLKSLSVMQCKNRSK
jgi:hypothetical protein